MTPEQLKLLKKLAEIGEVNIINRHVSILRKAISGMDISALELILEEDVSYQDTTKTIFLQKLKDVFSEFQKEDSKLIAYKGKCISEECSNKNKTGISFVGNNSGRYINFIIEENPDGSVKDIYNCSHFCTNQTSTDKTKKQLKLKVFKDEENDFTPTSTYLFTNRKSISAVNALLQFNDSEITKEQISRWIKNHKELYESMNWINTFYKDQSSFYNCYQHIKKVNYYLIIEEEAMSALKKFKSINKEVEISLLNWLINFEYLFHKLIFLHPDVVSEESIKTGRVILYKNYTIYFKTELLKNCVEFYDVFKTPYYEKLKKFNTLSKEEYENLIPFDDDYEEKSSLIYHLKVRGII